MKNLLLFFLLIFLLACNDHEIKESPTEVPKPTENGIEIIVLGTAQDAGYPQIGCQKECCTSIENNRSKGSWVSCLGLLDHDQNSFYIFDATPNFAEQYDYIKTTYPSYQLKAIFLTHAHIGHYTGLMMLGHEAMGAKDIPVYAMPKMRTFLSSNGPWSQLVDYNNITLKALENELEISFSNFKVVPFLVPHRDEFSETVGFKISGPSKKALFIPDINKWNIWDKNLTEEVRQVNYAFLDATFYEEEELPGRNMSEIPHPFVPETMALFSSSKEEERNKIHFIHLNHTNPLLRKTTKAYQETIEKGYFVSQTFDLHDL